MKIIDLNFQLSNCNNMPVGIAGPIVSEQMQDYILRMTREGNQVNLDAMLKAQAEAKASPYQLTLSDQEFAIVYEWCIKFSGFYSYSLEQLKQAFNV